VLCQVCRVYFSTGCLCRDRWNAKHRPREFMTPDSCRVDEMSPLTRLADPIVPMARRRSPASNRSQDLNTQNY